MTTDLQTNVLSANMVKKTMPACLLYALVQSVTFMVDNVIAGHFLSTDAVAAIALAMPAIGLMLSFTGMIMQGCYLKLLNALSKNSMGDYHRLFSLALPVTIIIDLAFIALCLFGTDGVLNAFGAAKADPVAIELSRLYMRTTCLELLFFSLGTLFQLVVISYGYRNISVICSVLCVVVNILASLLLIHILPENLKIAGLGFGSAIGTLVQMISALVIMKLKKVRVKFRFYPINRKNIIDTLDMLRRGFPSSADNMIDSFCGSIINRLILASFAEGTAVLALVTIIKTIFTIVRTIGRGVFYACEPLSGILDGWRDNEGIKKTFITGIKMGVIYAVCLAVILIAAKTPILSFYKMADNPDAHMGLILVAISGMVIVFPYAFNAIYESTGHLLLALAVSVIPDSILYPLLLPVTCGWFGITGIWIAMGFNFIIFFVIYYLIFALKYKTLRVPLERLLVLKDVGERVTELDVSVPVESKDVTFISEQLQGFLLNNGVADVIAYKAALCTEEIAADYIEHRNKSKKPDNKAYMDIKVFREEGKIKIVLRNYDEPYNPLVFERKEEEYSKIGITMVQKICIDISCSYAYHLNVVSIILPLIPAAG